MMHDSCGGKKEKEDPKPQDRPTQQNDNHEKVTRVMKKVAQCTKHCASFFLEGLKKPIIASIDNFIPTTLF